jgi:hypothetical protein
MRPWSLRMVRSVAGFASHRPKSTIHRSPIDLGFLSLDLRTVASKASPRHHG